MIIQGSFPGGRPHFSVLLNAGQGYLSLAESSYTIQTLSRHPNKFIIQKKMNDFRRENLAVQHYSESNNIKTYPLNIARLNFQSEGYPVKDSVLQFYKKIFETNLSDIMIHDGSGEAEAVGALAFTAGKDIYFAANRYNPYTPQGQRLLGHELTHVIQQKEGRVSNPHKEGVFVVYNPALEAEADRKGMYAAQLGECSLNSKYSSGRLIQLAVEREHNLRERKPKVEIQEHEKEIFGNITVMSRIKGGAHDNIFFQISDIVNYAKCKDYVITNETDPLITALKKENPIGTSQNTCGFCVKDDRIYVEGKNNYFSALEKIVKTNNADRSKNSYEIHNLGERSTGQHSEAFFIDQVGSGGKIYTTQSPCFFCCGLMERKKTFHTTMRISDPFPKKWSNPSGKYTLIETDAKSDSDEDIYIEFQFGSKLKKYDVKI